MTYPTHYIITEGVPQYVDPDGYDPDILRELPEGFWDTPKVWGGDAFVEDMDGVRAAKWAAVKAKRLAVEHGGAETPLGRMQTDPISQGKLNGAVTMALVAQAAGTPFSVGWTMSDNTEVAHDGPAIIAAGVAVGTHVATCHAVASGLRAQIEAAATVAELVEIDIDGVAWPAS